MTAGPANQHPARAYCVAKSLDTRINGALNARAPARTGVKIRTRLSVSSVIQIAGHLFRAPIIPGNYGDQFAAVPVTLYRTVSELFDFPEPVAGTSQ